MSVGARANAIRVALVEEPDVALWEKAFGLLLASPHHVGGNDRGWRADFDFALQAKQRTKWLDLARSGESPKAESLGESLARMRAEHATG